MMKFLALGLLLFAPVGVSGELPKIAIDELMENVDSFYDTVKDQKYEMRMVLMDADGTTKERRMSYAAKGEFLAITRFHFPDSVDGMGFLQEKGDNFHVYLPQFHKVRKVAAHTKRQSFMGSDFSYNDMNNRRYTFDYEAHLVDDSGDRYIVDLTPREGRDLQYSKLRLTVQPGTWMIDTIEYFDPSGEKVKRQIREEEVQIKGIWFQKRITMENLRTGHKTALFIDEITLNGSLSDELFSVRNLRRAN